MSDHVGDSGQDPIVPDDLSGLDDLIASEADETSEPVDGDDTEAAVSSDSSDAADPSSDAELSVTELVVALESVSTERDQYLDSLRRVQAEFENYKKAVAKRNVDERERANDKIISELLPVLDACDGAVANGSDDVAPVRNQLLAALERQGLERTDPADAPFNPEQHEAVMHEPSDEVSEPTVAEVLRTGYSWKGRVLRPAMVRVKG